MARRGKKYVKLATGKKKDVEYTLAQAVAEVKKNSYSKFDGTLEMHLVVNLPKDKDPKSVKGSLALPYSAGKEKKVYVFTTPENIAKALSAGADKAGLEDLVKEVQSGKVDFDIAIATSEVMPKIAVLGKELGPKGLMPNPKTGTVAHADTLEETVKAYKKGKQTFTVDMQGGVHLNVGKLSMSDENLLENIALAISTVEEVYGKSTNLIVKGYLAPTMGRSVKFKIEKQVVE